MIKTKIKLKLPKIQVLDEYYTGEPQQVEVVEVELLKPIIVKYSEADVTEFQTLMPVKIIINRK